MKYPEEQKRGLVAAPQAFAHPHVGMRQIHSVLCAASIPPVAGPEAGAHRCVRAQLCVLCVRPGGRSWAPGLMRSISYTLWAPIMILTDFINKTGYDFVAGQEFAEAFPTLFSPNTCRLHGLWPRGVRGWGLCEAVWIHPVLYLLHAFPYVVYSVGSQNLETSQKPCVWLRVKEP